MCVVPYLVAAVCQYIPQCASVEGGAEVAI